MPHLIAKDTQEFRALLQQVHHGFDNFFWNQPAQATAWFGEDETQHDNQMILAPAA